MLQKANFEDDFQPVEADLSYLLRPSYYLKLIKRRWAFFFLPFVLIAAAGVAAALLWPATYLSEGKILVQAQQIPTELVRPTVTSAAQERIQVIEQRTMTRDNLVAIADKFQLFPDKRTLMSVTELVALIRKQTKIKAVDLSLDFKQRSRIENPTVVFSVGFEYSDPATAARVANELMTRILNEDLRDRTNRATDTTKFLTREVQKLQADNAALDNKIAELKVSQGKSPSSGRSDQPSMLDQLKSELVQKGALYSDRHPQIQSLMRRIEAMEKANLPAPASADSPAVAANLEALLAQQESLKSNLEITSAKLAAARLGENLEKDQQSEKLEIIEQPTAPQDPVKPDRPKVAALAVVLALMAGVGFTFAAEFLDKGIRRSSDIFSIVDSQIVVSIPYITTASEIRRSRRRFVLTIVFLPLASVGALVAAYYFLPPLDLIIAKAQVGLFR
jgi:protein tyrosine kinase modulator